MAIVSSMKAASQIIVMMISLACLTSAQVRRLPRFEDYPAEVIQVSPAPAKIIGAQARNYRTRLSEGAKEEPNFAGHYTLVSWGIGTDCRMLAVADAKTGRVYFLPGVRAVLKMPSQVEDSIQYRADSRLLVISGEVWDGGRLWRDAATYYYEWGGGRLRLIRKTALKLNVPE